MTPQEALKSARETRCLEYGKNILNKTGVVFKQNFPGKKAVVVADENTLRVAGREVIESLKQSGVSTVEPFIYRDPGLYAEYKFVTQLTDSLKNHDAIPVAVGSGTINDLAKLASHETQRPYMCVATAASMDGYTAFGASITYKGSKQTFNCPAPTAVLADIEVIRNAPVLMNASGYADLLAKVTAGADWILADALGVEAIDQQSWKIVQGSLRSYLDNPEGVHAGEEQAVENLVNGLMMGGFAMQCHKTSRPASGAEHQFSHLWDMQHHTHNGSAPSHGFKVGIATLAVTQLYEYVFAQPLEKLDVEKACAAWPSLKAYEQEIRSTLDAEIADKAIEEVTAKYISTDLIRKQLTELRGKWPELKPKLQAQLMSYKEKVQKLKTVGAPTRPEEIGISRERLLKSYKMAYYLRRRFTVLDVAVRTNLLTPALSALEKSSATPEKVRA